MLVQVHDAMDFLSMLQLIRLKVVCCLSLVLIRNQMQQVLRRTVQGIVVQHLVGNRPSAIAGIVLGLLLHLVVLERIVLVLIELLIDYCRVCDWLDLMLMRLCIKQQLFESHHFDKLHLIDVLFRGIMHGLLLIAPVYLRVRSGNEREMKISCGFDKFKDLTAKKIDQQSLHRCCQLKDFRLKIPRRVCPNTSNG